MGASPRRLPLLSLSIGLALYFSLFSLAQGPSPPTLATPPRLSCTLHHLFVFFSATARLHPVSLGTVGHLRSLPAQMAPLAPPSLNYSINYCGENVQLKWTVIVGLVAPYLIGRHLIPGMGTFFFLLST